MSDELDKAGEPEEPEEDQSTHRPQPEAKFNARGYALSVRFHPEIKLDRKRGHHFAAALTDYLNLEKNEFESHKWTFLEPLPGEPACRFVITVSPGFIKLDVRSSNLGQEWVETRFGMVLGKFGELFKLQFLLQSEAIVHGTLPIDGDARTFLAVHVMGMKPNRVDSFGRPLHLLGLKFFFPPFAKKGEGDKPQITDWHLNVRAESLMEDPSKLFLEAEATWIEARPWDKEVVTQLTDHLGTVKDYLENNVMEFLQSAPVDDTDEDGDDPGGPGERG
jgi:hypothetical protein